MWSSVEEKIKEISERLKKTIHPIVLLDTSNNGEYVLGYFVRPDLVAQLRLTDISQDKASGFSYEGASKMLDSLLVKEDSDPRINTTQAGELYWKGALPFMTEFMISAIPVLKKK